VQREDVERAEHANVARVQAAAAALGLDIEVRRFRDLARRVPDRTCRPCGRLGRLGGRPAPVIAAQPAVSAQPAVRAARR
jgi:hypothetical protein